MVPLLRVAVDIEADLVCEEVPVTLGRFIKDSMPFAVLSLAGVDLSGAGAFATGTRVGIIVEDFGFDGDSPGRIIFETGLWADLYCVEEDALIFGEV